MPDFILTHHLIGGILKAYQKKKEDLLMNRLCIVMNHQWKMFEAILSNVRPDALICYAGELLDGLSQAARVRRHEDGNYYIHGKPMGTDGRVTIDCHDFFPEIPENRYIYRKDADLIVPLKTWTCWFCQTADASTTGSTL